MAIEIVDLPPGVANLLNQASMVGLQRSVDGAGHYAENLRYKYLIDKDRVSFAESTGVRAVEESGSGRVRGLDPSVAPSPASGK